MKYYLYKITNLVNCKVYIGVHQTNNLEDDYMGSPYTWNPKLDSLVKVILKDNFQTREDAIEYEAALIEKHIDDELNENYHIPNKGFHRKGRPMIFTDSYRKNLSNALKGRIFSKEHKRNLSNALKGNKLSEITKSKISKTKKEYYKQNEHHNAIKVICLKNGNEYDSYSHAAISNGVSRQLIARHCEGRVSRVKFKKIEI